MFVGIDVSKDRLDVHIRPSGESFSLPRDGAGIAALAGRLRAADPALIVLEATGGFEVTVAAGLAGAGLPLAVVNPAQIRAFARAVGRLAKTDRLDAEIIARFADQVRPEPRPVADAQAQALAELVARRRQLVEMVGMESNRRRQARSPKVLPGIERTLAELNQTIAGLVDELNRKPSRHLGASRRQLFEQIDRPALKPLPAEPYEYAEWKECRVGIDYHVEIAKHYYSVPHSLVRQPITARITTATIELFHRGRRVAAHLRSYAPRRHTTVAEHMPSAHRRYAGWTHERLRGAAADIGPGRHWACVEEVDFAAARGLDRRLFQEFATGQWLRSHQKSRSSCRATVSWGVIPAVGDQGKGLQVRALEDDMGVGAAVPGVQDDHARLAGEAQRRAEHVGAVAPLLVCECAFR